MAQFLTDGQLVRNYAEHRRDQDFENLVDRHLGLVFGTAMRRVGDRCLAEEATQNVFLSLAKKASSFTSESRIDAWLHRATILETGKILRTEIRRRNREQKAHELTIATDQEGNDLASLVPLLDEGLLRLRDSEREAIILRFFKGMSLRDVGCSLGLKEDAAQKRVAKSVQKLAKFFEERGYAVSTGALTAGLLAKIDSKVPQGFTTTVTDFVNEGLMAAAPSVALGFPSVLAIGNGKFIAACLVAVCFPIGYELGVRRSQEAIHDKTVSEIARNEREISRLLNAANQPDTASISRQIPSPVKDTSTVPDDKVSSTLFLWEDHPDLVRIRKKDLDKISMNVVDRDFTLTDEVCDLLGLTDSERSQLQAVADESVAKYRVLEAEHTTELSKHPDRFIARGEKITFKTEAFPEEGERLKAELLTAIGKLLGPERTAFLLKHAAPVVRRELSNFGTVEKTVSIAKEDSSENLTVYVALSDENGMFQSSSMVYSPERPLPNFIQNLVKE